MTESSNVYHQLTQYVGRTGIKITAGKRKYFIYIYIYDARFEVHIVVWIKLPILQEATLSLCK